MLLARVCKSLIQDGALTLIDADGRTHRFGRPSRPADVVVRLHDRSLHHRILLSPSLALGEAYMDGSLTMERGGIYDLLELCAEGMGRLESHPALQMKRALERPARFVQERAPILGARARVAHHYDLSDVLYDQFLDWDRQYSCAYFSDPRMTLEEAQQAKKHHLASKLLLRPGQKVLDVGSGWGGLALHLADAEHVDVTGITLSTEQLAVARRRALEAELSRRVSFHLRDFHEEAGRYDRVVSVGMFEHLGTPRYAEFFRKIHDVLADDGIAVVHSIGRMTTPAPMNAWLRKYIFPNAYFPALSEVLPAVEKAGLCLTDVEVLRLHYAETLRHWRKRFVGNWERVAEHYDARFCRMWEFYLALSEADFRRGSLMVFQLQLGKRADIVPLTRDYLYERTASSDFQVELAA
ncbi:Cyclopropane-fatty-acyl-phospholipid synthase [Minicystis rosea]|nr:Cyclopropane-fatty-acyl-phospholipid synthase [Minicystis rosea]